MTMNDPASGRDVADLIRENAMLRQQVAVLRAERDELLDRLPRRGTDRLTLPGPGPAPSPRIEAMVGQIRSWLEVHPEVDRFRIDDDGRGLMLTINIGRRWKSQMVTRGYLEAYSRPEAYIMHTLEALLVGCVVMPDIPPTP